MFRGTNTPAVRSERWLGVVQNLVECIESFSGQHEFLREIDRLVIKDWHKGFAPLLDFVVPRLSALVGAPQVSFYLLEGGEYTLARSTAPVDAVPRGFSSDAALDFFSLQPEGTGIWMREEGQQPLLGFQAETVLAARAIGQESEIGLLVVASDKPYHLTQFTDSDPRRFLVTVAGQVALGYSYQQSMITTTNLWTLSEALYKQQLEPSACVDTIAKRLETFLPPWHRMDETDVLYVQILFVEGQGEKRHLVIRGSSHPDNNPGLTRVQLGRSVCGLLIEQPDRPYVLCDPLMDPVCRERYRWYLGKEDGQGQTAIRSELAVPLEHKGQRFAIINLESKAVNAFGEVFARKFLALAERFVPILHATAARIEQQAMTQMSTLASLESYLFMLAMQFNHAVTTPWLAIKTDLDMLSEKPAAQAPEAMALIEKIRRATEDVLRIEHSFSTDISGFAGAARHNLGSLIDAAIALVKPEELKKQGIEIECDIDRSIQVNCSLFMKEVFYNILNNSSWWLQRKQEVMPGFQGLIRILVQKVEEPDQVEEVQLNRFCRIVFWDNGLGTDKEDKAKIMEDKFTRRGKAGRGFGLFAAKQYVTSLGGKIEVESDPGENFEVTINMRRADD